MLTKVQRNNSFGRKEWILELLCKLDNRLVDEGVLVVLVGVLDALWRLMRCQSVALVRIARCICCGKRCRLMILLDNRILVLRECLAVDISAVDLDRGRCVCWIVCDVGH